MLVLGLNLEENIELVDTRTGEKIATIKYLGRKNGIERLGFEAPRHINIGRKKLTRGRADGSS